MSCCSSVLPCTLFRAVICMNPVVPVFCLGGDSGREPWKSTWEPSGRGKDVVQCIASSGNYNARSFVPSRSIANDVLVPGCRIQDLAKTSKDGSV